MAVNAADARGLTFECKPGCGFCCTVAPLVLPHEAQGLRPKVVKLEDGTLRIPISGQACSALGSDRRCGAYEARPAVCRIFPYQVHAGRRIQVTMSLACPGVAEGGPGESAEEAAARAAELALAQPGAREMAARAKETFTEFDRRMKEWGVGVAPDKLRGALLPHVELLAQPATLAPFLAGVEGGDLAADARQIGALFDTETDNDLLDLYSHAAEEAFDEPDTVLWVEPHMDFAWTRVAFEKGAIALRRPASARSLDPQDLPIEWDENATRTLASYLTRLLHRDHTEGAAAWLVDASGYQATPAAAYARVVAEASLQVALRASLLASDDGLDHVDEAHAKRGIMAYEAAYHSLPTLGARL